MSDPKSNPDQAGAENPDENPPANPPARDLDLAPVYSMEGYPMLPLIDYTRDLRQQAVNLNRLSHDIEARLQREVTAGRQRLAQMGISQAEFAAQYGGEFQIYQFSTLPQDSIVPGTEMSCLYLELIRICIYLLFKESVHRENKSDKRRTLRRDAESQQDVMSNSGALTETTDSGEPSPTTPSPTTPSSASSSETFDLEAGGIPPLHRDPELRRSTITSSLNTYSARDIIEHLDVLCRRLNIHDPATHAFLTRLQALLRYLESHYSTADESLDISQTSADVSDLVLDSAHSSANASANASANISRRHSYSSATDLSNLPEDKPKEDKPEEDDGEPPK